MKLLLNVVFSSLLFFLSLTLNHLWSLPPSPWLEPPVRHWSEEAWMAPMSASQVSVVCDVRPGIVTSAHITSWWGSPSLRILIRCFNCDFKRINKNKLTRPIKHYLEKNNLNQERSLDFIRCFQYYLINKGFLHYTMKECTD